MLLLKSLVILAWLLTLFAVSLTVAGFLGAL
jgi:hypothetical protein